MPAPSLPSHTTPWSQVAKGPTGNWATSAPEKSDTVTVPAPRAVARNAKVTVPSPAGFSGLKAARLARKEATENAARASVPSISRGKRRSTVTATVFSSKPKARMMSR
jgi:hypothetical protein